MDDISVYVLKPFPFSRNGVKEDFAAVGKTLLIPGRLFGGLNKEGYVRRADIGDGHFSLRLGETIDIHNGAMKTILPTEVVAEETHEVTRKTQEASEEIIASVKAPQPPVKTADLSEDEAAAIADGSWKNLKFFAKRSIAAKVSDQPVKDGADADAAIEAYIAAQKA